MRFFDQAVKDRSQECAGASEPRQRQHSAGPNSRPLTRILIHPQASPNNFMANYLRGLELAKQQIAEADRIFDRISPAFSGFPAGYYLQGATNWHSDNLLQAESILGKY